jgi:hypothetical protein
MDVSPQLRKRAHYDPARCIESIGLLPELSLRRQRRVQTKDLSRRWATACIPSSCFLALQGEEKGALPLPAWGEGITELLDRDYFRIRVYSVSRID